MLRKDPMFSRTSERERNFRMCICLIGLFVILYAATVFFTELAALNGLRDYFLRSAFMAEDIPKEISGFTK